jgi:hypothetical protein
MKITFLQSGESPDFGAFAEGDEKDLDGSTAQVLKDRGVVEFTAPAVQSAIRNSKSAIKKEE